MDIQPHINQAKKEGILFSDNCTYFGYYTSEQSDEHENLAGFCAFKISGNKATLKCSYVLPEYRNQGIHTKMTKIRLEVLKMMGIKSVDANCTSMSIRNMIKLGTKIVCVS